MSEQKTVSLLLRIGIAFSFIYVTISASLQPDAWIGFFPVWLRSAIPVSQNIFLGVWGVTEIVLAVWLLSGYRIFYAAILSAFTMAGIVIFNIGAMDIVFRDVSIMFSAIALAVLSRNSTK